MDMVLKVGKTPFRDFTPGKDAKTNCNILQGVDIFQYLGYAIGLDQVEMVDPFLQRKRTVYGCAFKQT
jgi:hypothetical protein